MYLLHGENVFQSWNELLRLKKEISKDKSIEFINLDSEEIDISKLSIASYSLFSKKYYFIFKRFFTLPKELRTKIWEEVVKLKLDVILWEDGNADKRSKIYKEMNKIGIVREFNLLKEREMYNWIQKELRNRNIKADMNFVHELYFRYGNNQFIVHNELEKFSIYLKLKNSKSAELVVEEVDYSALSEGMVQDNWKFIELFFTKKKKEAIHYLSNIELEVEEQKMIIGGIVSSLRNVFIVKSYAGEQLNFVASKLHIHPFVLSKSGIYAKYFTTQRLEKLYEQLMNFDFSLNLSRIDFKLGMVLLIMSL